MLPPLKNAIKSVTQIDEMGRRIPLSLGTVANGARTINVPCLVVLETMARW